jgi:hypothetical protein
MCCLSHRRPLGAELHSGMLDSVMFVVPVLMCGKTVSACFACHAGPCPRNGEDGVKACRGGG